MMRKRSAWLIRIALLVLVPVWNASAVSAQTRLASPDLGTTLVPGMTVWVTDTSHREHKGRIVSVADDVVMTTIGENVTRIPTAEIVRVRTRQSDSVLDGALIGAGAGVASGLFLCRLTEPWDVCRANVGPLATFGAIGAGIGVAVDALIRGRRTIYQASETSPHVYASPIVGRHTAGLQVSINF